MTNAYCRVYTCSMTIQDVQPATADPTLDKAVVRLQYALGCEPEEAKAMLMKDPDRRARIARFVRADEVENEAFYREPGDR